jgi:4a-hydroxytetrahydrobiopterin dehydratase
VPKLTDDQVTAALADLPGWEREEEGDLIVKTFELETFPAAIRFVVALADRAEAANHHPDIDIRWRRVRIALTTHDDGGLSEKDVALAGEIEGLAGAYS